MPTLDTVLQEVDQFIDSEKSHSAAPHVIDVILPLLCAYLPVWWGQGPDNISLTAGYVPVFCLRKLAKNIEIIFVVSLLNT